MKTPDENQIPPISPLKTEDFVMVKAEHLQDLIELQTRLEEAEAREAVLSDRINKLAGFVLENTKCGCPPVEYKPDCKRHNLLYPLDSPSTRSKQLLDLVEAAVGYTSKTFGCVCADEILHIMKGCQCGFQALSETAKPFIKKEGA